MPSATRTLPERSTPTLGPRAPGVAFPVIDRVVGARTTRVLDLDAQTASIVRLQLERPEGYTFRAGQYALLRVSTDRGPDLRPLSLAGTPSTGPLEFATRIGSSSFKQAVLGLRSGDIVKVSRPMGGLAYDAARPAVVIAGGIGITPVRSMLLATASSSAQAPVRLLFSNHSADDIPFVEELAEMVSQRENLSVTWVLTSSAAAALPGPVHVGRLTAELLRQQAVELPGAKFYLTGPAAMVRDVKARLRIVGVAGRRIETMAQGYRRSAPRA